MHKRRYTGIINEHPSLWMCAAVCQFIESAGIDSMNTDHYCITQRACRFSFFLVSIPLFYRKSHSFICVRHCRLSNGMARLCSAYNLTALWFVCAVFFSARLWLWFAILSVCFCLFHSFIDEYGSFVYRTHAINGVSISCMQVGYIFESKFSHLRNYPRVVHEKTKKKNQKIKSFESGRHLTFTFSQCIPSSIGPVQFR